MYLMHRIRLTLRLLALLVLLTLGACGSASSEMDVEPRAPTATNAATQTALPIRLLDGMNPKYLIIPAIGVNAYVESVGTRSNGDMATPTRKPWEDVGWYNLGPHPGERGSAVIAGHVDRPGGYPAVFWRLRDLHIGDQVIVKNSAGKTLHFRVARIALYSSHEAPIQDIFGNWGGIYLNLITCAGVWIPSEHQTTLRVVVYTSLA